MLYKPNSRMEGPKLTGIVHAFRSSLPLTFKLTKEQIEKDHEGTKTWKNDD